nr:MAG TPA: hypothetical protein [Bacteriophage sp.]
MLKAYICLAHSECVLHSWSKDVRLAFLKYAHLISVLHS